MRETGQLPFAIGLGPLSIGTNHAPVAWAVMLVEVLAVLANGIATGVTG